MVQGYNYRVTERFENPFWRCVDSGSENKIWDVPANYNNVHSLTGKYLLDWYKSISSMQSYGSNSSVEWTFYPKLVTSVRDGQDWIQNRLIIRLAMLPCPKHSNCYRNNSSNIRLAEGRSPIIRREALGLQCEWVLVQSDNSGA